MTLLLILSAPVVALLVARWAWRFHLRALRLLGPGLVTSAGVSAAARSAELVSVLVEDDIVLVGLRTVRAASTRQAGTTLRAPQSTLVLSLGGLRSASLARLERWQASQAPVLVWRNDTDNTLELCQLHTGQRVRLPVLG